MPAHLQINQEIKLKKKKQDWERNLNEKKNKKQVEKHELQILCMFGMLECQIGVPMCGAFNNIN